MASIEETLLSVRPDRRGFLRAAMLGGVGVAGAGGLMTLLDACGASASGSGNDLVSAAKAEGKLNVIALPPDWSNYGQIIDTFQKKYGITVNSAAPNDASAQENQALISLKGQSRAPDVVDVTPTIADTGQQQGLYRKYKVSTWSSIPENMKQADGYWYGDYYGVISFGSNRSVVKNPPQDWADLLKPEYKNMVAIDGDPRSAGDAFGAVMAASLGNGGSLDDITPGIEFFAELKQRGNLVPVDALAANIAKGAAPIAIIWDYLNIANKRSFAGNPGYTVSIPKTGVFGNFYCQAISATAPNPKSAELWEEFLYSDQGQLLYLAGYAHPARYQALAEAKKIPANLEAQLPPVAAYAKVRFPTNQQSTKAAAALAAQWGPKVANA